MKFKLLAIGLLLLVSGVASAQTITVKWTNPTLLDNGAPITAMTALSKFQLWMSNAPLTVLPETPTLELPASAPLQTQYVYTGVSGQTVYVRLKACNPFGCSVASTEASAVVPWPPSAPGAPQNVTIQVDL